jgi:triosephosphate isomerase (TIM)
MRQKIVAGNWKMNLLANEARELLINLNDTKSIYNSGVEVIVATPSIYLSEFSRMIGLDDNLQLASQNVSEFSNGAYTGEVSSEMLASLGINFTLIGHSERRQYFNESNEDLKLKVDKAYENDITPIFCIGENLKEREDGIYFNVVKKQLKESVFHLNPEEFESIIIAYEPVWAIGTGVTASADQAQEIHSFIRSLIAENYTQEIADKIRILYGGSCKPSNAKEIFEKEDVDGGLIGGAALKKEDFLEIIKAAE